jgi:hypothetical protein
MDYLKYRGCEVNMLQRYAASHTPKIEKETLSRCLEEDVEDE